MPRQIFHFHRKCEFANAKEPSDNLSFQTKTGVAKIYRGGSCVKGEWIIETTDNEKKPLKEIGDVLACVTNL